MHVAVIASSLALRTGLAALVSGAPAGTSGAPGAIEVTYQAAQLEDVCLADADVWLVAGSLFAAENLPDEAGRLALLALHDGPPEEAADLIERLRQAGLYAWGLLPLEAGADEIRLGLQCVAGGLVCLHPLYGAKLSAPHREGESEPWMQPLSGRERQVLQLLAQGQANKQIAAALGISEHTVKFHVTSIFNKLGVGNRAEAVSAAIKAGWLFI
jgi:DNA-binding NarL/FixJ family response regulator